jgi:hypothetical protein
MLFSNTGGIVIKAGVVLLLFFANGKPGLLPASQPSARLF